MTNEKMVKIPLKEKEMLIEFAKDTQQQAMTIIDASAFLLSHCKAMKIILDEAKEIEI